MLSTVIDSTIKTENQEGNRSKYSKRESKIDAIVLLKNSVTNDDVCSWVGGFLQT